jgi:hypothetical protein
MLFSNKSLVKKSGRRAGLKQNLNEVHARCVDPRMAPLTVCRQDTKASGARWRAYRGREYLAWGETKKAAIKSALREEKKRAKEAAKEAAASYETAVSSTGATGNRKPVARYRNICARWTGAAWRWEAFLPKERPASQCRIAQIPTEGRPGCGQEKTTAPEHFAQIQKKSHIGRTIETPDVCRMQTLR